MTTDAVCTLTADAPFVLVFGGVAIGIGLRGLADWNAHERMESCYEGADSFMNGRSSHLKPASAYILRCSVSHLENSPSSIASSFTGIDVLAWSPVKSDRYSRIALYQLALRNLHANHR